MAVELERGRPKAQIPRQKRLDLRLTDFEFKKIARVAKEKNLTKTDAILRGIELLERDKPKKYVNIKELQKKRREEWIKKGLKIYDDDDDDY